MGGGTSVGGGISSISSDGTTRIWDAETGEELLTLSTLAFYAPDARWSPDGKYLAVAMEATHAEIWRVWQSTTHQRRACRLPDAVDPLGVMTYNSVTYPKEVMRMVIGRFYAMTGALIWSPTDGRYLVLRRSAEKDFGAGGWECPTGRVDQGEGFAQAVHREVREELGIGVELDFVIDTVHMYRGEAVPENEMVGVLFCCSVDGQPSLDLSWEHSEFRWVTAEEAEGLLPDDHWLLRAILRAESIRILSPPALQEYVRTVGFS